MMKDLVLEQRYQSLMQEGDLLYFCKSLAAYIDFISTTEPYKQVFDAMVGEYQAHISAIDKIEEKVQAEMLNARDELQAVVQQTGVDPKTFKRHQTFTFSQHSDLFEEFEAYLQGRAVGNGFRSDTLEHCLFDIAANLLSLGYGKKLKRYIVSDDEYGFYCYRVTGNGAITGNMHGNFIFSPTLPARAAYIRKFDRERTFKPWGVFVELYLFKRAHEVLTNDLVPQEALQVGFSMNNKISVIDLVKTQEMYQELSSMVPDTTKWVTRKLREANRPEFHALDIDELKKSAEATYIHLLALKPASPLVQDVWFEAEKGLLHIGSQNVQFRMFTDQYHTLRVLFDNSVAPNKEYFYSELAEKLDQYKQITDKQLYNYFAAIKRRVASKTGINDLFITTNQSVRLSSDFNFK